MDFENVSVQSGSSYGQKNNNSLTCVTEVTSKMQIFVHIPHSSKHLVQYVPKDITVGALVEKSLADAGLSDQYTTLELAGRAILNSKDTLQTCGARNMDTLVIKTSMLLGGSKEPLLE